MTPELNPAAPQGSPACQRPTCNDATAFGDSSESRQGHAMSLHREFKGKLSCIVEGCICGDFVAQYMASTATTATMAPQAHAGLTVTDTQEATR